MERHNSDHIKEVFKSRFSLDSIEKETWNRPSQQLLHNALRKKNNRKRKSLVLLLILFVIAGTVSFLLLNKESQSNSKLESKNTTLSASIAEQKLMENSNHLNEEESLDLENSMVTKNITTPSKHEKVVPNASKRSISIGEFKSVNEGQKSLVLNTLYSNDFEEAKTTAEKILNIKQLNEINSLSFLLLTEEKQFELGFTQANFQTSIESTQKKYRSLKIESQISYGASSFTMNGASLSDPTLSGYDNLNEGSGFTIGLKYSHSNWFLQPHLGYNRINNTSLSSESLIYQSSNEFTDNEGETAYGMEWPINTPFGTMNHFDQFKVNGSYDNMPLSINTQNQHQLSLFNIGLNLGRTIVASTKSNFYIIAGLDYNHILTNSAKVNLNVSLDKNTMMQREDLEMTLNEYNQNFIGLNFGIGYEYQFNKATNLIISTQFDRSLSQLNTSNRSKLHLNNYSISLGFGHNLF